MGNCVAGNGIVGPEVTPIPGYSGFGAGFSQGKLGGLIVVSGVSSPTIWNDTEEKNYHENNICCFDEKNHCQKTLLSSPRLFGNSLSHENEKSNNTSIHSTFSLSNLFTCNCMTKVHRRNLKRQNFKMLSNILFTTQTF